jgi:hypothetical protein
MNDEQTPSGGVPPWPPVPPDSPPDVPPAGAPAMPEAEPVGPRRNTALIAGLVLALAIGTGVGVGIGLRGSGEPEVAEVPPSPVPAGWAIQEVPAEGFAVALPPAWRDVPTTSADEALGALRDANPGIAELVENQLGGTVSAFIKLLAFDLESPTLAEQFATNMNVVVAPVPSGIRFEDFVEANLSQLRAVPGLAGDIKQETVTLPAGRAAQVRSRLTLQSPDGEKIAAITQYLLVRGTRGYILSFSTTPTHEPTYTDLFTRIAGTFRYL